MPTAPPNVIGIFGIFPVGNDLQEPLITRHATNIFGWPRSFAGDAGPVVGCSCKRQELLHHDTMPPAIPEIIVVAENSTVLEVQQANFPLIEDAGIVICGILRQDLDFPVSQTTDAELIEMIVPPVERGLNSEMHVLEVPMRWQKDNKTPQRSIAGSIGLSAPAVQRRIKRMEEGTIAANVAIIEPTHVRQEIIVFVEVEMQSEFGATHDATKKSFAEAPEVQQCYYVTGEVDFILLVVVRTMADYEAMTRRLFFGNNNVKRFRSFVAMDRVKVGLNLSLDAKR